MDIASTNHVNIPDEQASRSREHKVFAVALSLLVGVGILVTLTALTQNASAQISKGAREPGVPNCGPDWAIVSSLNVGPGNNDLYGVAVVSANNVWAVGYYYDTIVNQLQTLTEHWNGSAWSVVA